MLRQDRVLQRPEECGLHAEQEEHGEQRRDALQVKRDSGKRRDADLADLDETDESRLLEPVGQRPSRCREQKERQDEKNGRQVVVYARGVRGDQAAEGEDGHEGPPEQVVVERPEELRDEQGREPTCAEQAELGGRCRRWGRCAECLVVRCLAQVRSLGRHCLQHTQCSPVAAYRGWRGEGPANRLRESSLADTVSSSGRQHLGALRLAVDCLSGCATP